MDGSCSRSLPRRFPSNPLAYAQGWRPIRSVSFGSSSLCPPSDLSVLMHRALAIRSARRPLNTSHHAMQLSTPVIMSCPPSRDALVATVLPQVRVSDTLPSNQHFGHVCCCPKLFRNTRFENQDKTPPAPANNTKTSDFQRKPRGYRVPQSQ